MGLFFLIIIFLHYIRRKLANSKKNVPISRFKCLDGHVVRSKGELIIDNYLHLNGIRHIYEKTININGKPIKYDWYLPEGKLYIEYWGYHGKEYEARKKEKMRLYEKANLRLVSIENEIFDDIYKKLREMLGKYFNLTNSRMVSKYCPNCGVSLDGRFKEQFEPMDI